MGIADSTQRKPQELLDLIIPGTVLSRLTSDLYPLLISFCKFRPGRIKSHYQYKFHIGKHGALPGQFNNPWNLAFNEDGELFVVDHMNHRIQVFEELPGALKFSREIAMPGEKQGPAGFCIRPDGSLIVGFYLSHTVQVISPTGQLIKTLASRGGDPDVYAPYDIALGDQGRIIVADSGNHRFAVYFDDDSPSTTLPTDIKSPAGIKPHLNGNFITVDQSTYKINMIDSKGNILQEFNCSYPESDRTVLSPFSCVVDCDGNVIIPDHGNNKVSIWSSKGEFLTAFGLPNNPNFVNSEEALRNPVCAAINQDGDIYITDFANNRIVCFG